jgi:dihydrofolate reductase
MSRIIVIEFVTLDGVITDPDGTAGTPQGGWAFRHGPATVAGDKFRLGATMDEGVMLLGRATWEQFAKLWPTRSDAFSLRMNAVPKLVASRTAPDVSAWANSAVLEGDLLDRVRDERIRRDVIVAGSGSVVHALQQNDLVDEYRLLTFPSIVGSGERLFPAAGPSAQLECTLAEQAGAAVLTFHAVLREPVTR